MTRRLFRKLPDARHLAVGLASTCLTSLALAAPATSQELSGNTDSTPSAGSADGRRAIAPVVTGVPQSRTVELLLQMQDQPDNTNGDAAKGAARSAIGRAASANSATTASGRTGSSAEPDANPVLNLKSSLMGAGSSNRQDGTDNRESSRPGTTDGTVAPSTGMTESRGDDGQPRNNLLSNPVIRFIRENRALTIGVSLAVLLGLWGTATFSMRRGR